MGITDKILCTSTHEYLLEKGEGNFIVGLTDYAVEQLGDIVFLELPEVGATYQKGDSFGAIESVKAASEIYMPITGKVVEVNEALVDAPETLNQDVYENGWLIKIQSEAPIAETADLMEYEEYKESVQ